MSAISVNIDVQNLDIYKDLVDLLLYVYDNTTDEHMKQIIKAKVNSFNYSGGE